MLVDVTDIERPVGFNPLCITEQDSLQYRIARDLVIDDLLSYFHRNYDHDMLGPFFETHFRGMMSLLLGVEPQTPERVPNLLLFRSLYTNKELRNRLVAELAGRDMIIADFIKEVTSAVGESSLQNTATYITSKFNRFVSDLSATQHHMPEPHTRLRPYQAARRKRNQRDVCALQFEWRRIAG